MSIVDDFASGYIGGHGTRLVMQVNTSSFKKPLPANIKQKFLINVHNFNPSIIAHQNSYGWSPMVNKSTGEALAGAQKFDAKNSVSSTELTGIVYPSSGFALDNLLLKTLKKEDVIQDFKDLDILASKGVYFLLTEVKHNKGINAGNWFIKSFNYDLSHFLTGDTASKIEYSLQLERKNPDD